MKQNRETYGFIMDETGAITWFNNLSGNCSSTLDIQRTDFVRIQRNPQNPKKGWSGIKVPNRMKAELLKEFNRQGILRSPLIKNTDLLRKKKPFLKKEDSTLDNNLIWVKGDWAITDYGRSLGFDLCGDKSSKGQGSGYE